MTGYRTPKTYTSDMFPARVIDLGLPAPLRRSGLRVAALSAAFAMRRKQAEGYRTRVFSGSTSVFAAPEKSSPGRNVFYCHTPPRFIYDQAAFFAAHASPLQRAASTVFAGAYRRGYERAVARMHSIIANSETVRRRIDKYLGRDSVVIYPPCDVNAFRWQTSQGYYLSTARLSRLKRVEAIVAAFLKMPGKRLVVTSGGEEESRLRRLAAGAANISFTGWTDEARMRDLIARSIATIYVPIDEDFGMSPVESMAAGKPCISVAEGGPLESIVDGETGLLMKADFTSDDLIAAVEAIDSETAANMRVACEARARKFDRQTFLGAMRAIVGDGAGL